MTVGGSPSLVNPLGFESHAEIRHKSLVGESLWLLWLETRGRMKQCSGLHYISWVKESGLALLRDRAPNSDDGARQVLMVFSTNMLWGPESVHSFPKRQAIEPSTCAMSTANMRSLLLVVLLAVLSITNGARIPKPNNQELEPTGENADQSWDFLLFVVSWEPQLCAMQVMRSWTDDVRER